MRGRILPVGSNFSRNASVVTTNMTNHQDSVGNWGGQDHNAVPDGLEEDERHDEWDVQGLGVSRDKLAN